MNDQPASSAAKHIPLPERMRPQQLGDVFGQEHLLGSDGVISGFLKDGRLPSLLLWGPPGCGKTTMARLLAGELGQRFAPFSAVLNGVPDLRKLLDEAEKMRNLGEETLLFIDEIHRFNKAQQDALLPHVENGAITLIGATTENPSFSCNRALLSRCRVFQLHGLEESALDLLVQRVIDEEIPRLTIDDDAKELLFRLSGGDGRRVQLMLEEAWALAKPEAIAVKQVQQVASGVRPGHDRAGDSHYDVASAFIKSMRASDVQAALFYLARQVEAGEDPTFIARRVAIFASEDVGLADPQAMVQAQAAFAIVEKIGLPEAIYPLTQAVIYCASAPKSNACKAYFAAAAACKENPGAEVPMFLRNAPTSLMKDLGYKEGYVYDHDTPDHYAGQQCLPDDVLNETFFEPGQFGFEKEIKKRMQWWEERRKPRETK